MQPSEEIKERVNIVDLIAEHVQLKKAGVNFRGLCPFHQEKNPSFLVSPSKQIWHCFGCGLGGDIFEFVKQTEAVEFPDALRILANRAGVTLKQTHGPGLIGTKPDKKNALLEINKWAALYFAKVLQDSPSASGARNYLVRRGLQITTIKKWQIGYAPDDFHAFENFIVKKGYQKREALTAGLLVEKNGQYFDRFRGRITFPLFDIHGRIVGFTARVLDLENSSVSSTDVHQAKYINSPETDIYSKSRLIYGLNFAKTEIRKLDQVVVVEGNMDAITSHEAGFANVVASSGTALTFHQLETIKRFTFNISFAFDVDQAGLLATRRAVEMALESGMNVKIISIPKALAKDPDELIRRNPALWSDQVKGAMNFLDFYFQAIFANISLDSSLDKKQAVAEFLPLLSLLPDPIDRSHYLQKLSARIGVDQKIILELLNRFSRRSSVGENKGMAKSSGFQSKKTMQEILERRFLGFFLKFPDVFSGALDVSADDFHHPGLRQIFEAVAPVIENQQFVLENFLQEHPKFATEVNLLIFALENELSHDTDWNIDDLKNEYLNQFRFFVLKNKMQTLEQKIKQAEQDGGMHGAKILISEFNHLSQELSKYHGKN